MPSDQIPAPDVPPLLAARQARGLIRASRSATLATILDNGPYASLVTVGFDMDCSPILLLSNLAEHTKSIKKNAQVSLLFEAASGLPNPQSGPRVTVQGTIVPTDDAFHARRFTTRHPASKLYAEFRDFNFYRVEMDQFHFVGGFAAALWLSRNDFRVGMEAAAALADCEASVVAHMNGDHADAVNLYANILLGQPGKSWQMIGIDPDGFDLKLNNSFARGSFEEPVCDAASCREALIKLASQAREGA